jgi:hypothetical protein
MEEKRWITSLYYVIDKFSIEYEISEKNNLISSNRNNRMRKRSFILS